MRQLPNAAERTPDLAFPPCLDRRAFLGSSAMLAAAALLTSACGDGNIGGNVTSSGPISVTVKLSDYPALTPVGAIVKLTGVSTPIAVVHESATVYRAFSLICPHEGTTVGPTSTGFLCPNHEARFSAMGQWIGGERTTSLREFTVTANTTAGTLAIVS